MYVRCRFAATRFDAFLRIEMSPHIHMKGLVNHQCNFRFIKNAADFMFAETETFDM